MIQDLRSGKDDPIDLRSEAITQAALPQPVAQIIQHVDSVSLDFWNVVRELLTTKWCISDKQKRKRPSVIKHQPCTPQPDDNESLVFAGYVLRLIVLHAMTCSSRQSTALHLSDSQWRLVFKPFSCCFMNLQCKNLCATIYNLILSDAIVVRLRTTFPRGLKRTAVPDHHDQLQTSVSYTLTDIIFLDSSTIKTIRPRCGTSGRHLRRSETCVSNVAICEDHTEDNHSDCSSEGSVEELAIDEVPKSTEEEEEESEESEEESEEKSAEVEAPFVPTRTPTSPAELEWVRIKEKDGIENRPLDEIMDMIGLEDIKLYLLQLLGKINTAKRQEIDMSKERLGTVFLGNPGTGKTTVARLFSKFLAKIGALPGSKFVEISGVMLARDGVHETKRLIETIYYESSSSLTGGTFFVDDAYQLMEHSGEKVVDYLLGQIEEKRGKIAFVFAGYEKQMEEFLSYNPGMTSRLPHRLKFTDFNQGELLALLQQNVIRRFQEKMKIEDGSDGLYMRVVSKRLGRRAGNNGFGNAREVENVFDRITTRQATRLEKARKNDEEYDDFFLSKEDLIGPEPSDALVNSEAYKKLQRMVGLESVKRSLRELVDRAQDNYKRELKELPIVEASLHRLFLGGPGTGKTTVAKLYGEILADIGLLSTSEVVFKIAADFIGEYIGWSERYTRQILEASKGKVLVIDEAYMLAGPKRAGRRSEPDCFRQAVIDTLVSTIQGTPGEDRAVLLLGYEDRMMDLLQDCNPGLMRRFPPESAFYFEDYEDEQLLSILNNKLEDQGLVATEFAKEIAIDVLAKCRRRPNFGNAGEIENLLGRAKARFQRRIVHLSFEERTGEVLLQPQDFDPEYDRIKDAVQNCQRLFSDVVGCEEILDKLIGYIKTAENLKQMNLPLEDYLPFNYVFKGPPGTGKTTTARKIGKIFYDMGLLGSSDVVECSVTDLVAEYCGQTGPKVIQKLDCSLGKVLFIDEAYRLNDGKFAGEALDELVDSLTKPRYKGKLIVVLAGYENEMNDLLEANPGLCSRFSEEICFSHLDADNCLDLLVRKVEIVPGLKMSLRQPSIRSNVKGAFNALSQLNGWGNGRDIETISKKVIGSALRSGKASHGILHVDDSIVLAEMKGFYTERLGRSGGNAPRPNRRRGGFTVCS